MQKGGSLMYIPSTIFREYDSRGIADTDLADPVVVSIGKAFGTWLARKGATRVSIGGDIRLSTERIEKALVEGLTWAGIDVLLLGTVTTPMLYWSIHRFGLDGGVMVTGSHNPSDMNGLKLSCGTATIYGEDIRQLYRMITEDDMVPGNPVGTLEYGTIREEYKDMLISKITLGPRRLKVVADTGNGTAGILVRPLLEALGCEVFMLNEEPDGRFPNHHPDPQKRENLLSLIQEVKTRKADVGIAFDGDADRLGVVDERGEIIWGDILMALFWGEILPKHPGAEAIVEVKCSQSLVDEINRLGGKPLFWKSGHSLIKAKMKEIGAVFAGELSGHFFFADEYFGFDDSFYAAARLFRILSNTDVSLSGLLAHVPVYQSTDEIRIDCPDEEKFDVVERIRDKAIADHEAITVDGVRILYAGGWGLVRASNTQPVIVTRCEGQTSAELESISSDLKKRILAEGLPNFDWRV